MKQSMTPLDVMSASLTPVSIESFASPVSLSHPVRAERPAPQVRFFNHTKFAFVRFLAHLIFNQVIEACANASADLSVTTREGVRKDMIFNHNDDLDAESRYQSTYQTTVSDRHAVNQPKLRTGLLEAKKVLMIALISLSFSIELIIYEMRCRNNGLKSSRKLFANHCQRPKRHLPPRFNRSSI
jgi:hypothetical protein